MEKIYSELNNVDMIILVVLILFLALLYSGAANDTKHYFWVFSTTVALLVGCFLQNLLSLHENRVRYLVEIVFFTGIVAWWEWEKGRTGDCAKAYGIYNRCSLTVIPRMGLFIAIFYFLIEGVTALIRNRLASYKSKTESHYILGKAAVLANLVHVFYQVLDTHTDFSATLFPCPFDSEDVDDRCSRSGSLCTWEQHSIGAIVAGFLVTAVFLVVLPTITLDSKGAALSKIDSCCLVFAYSVAVPALYFLIKWRFDHNDHRKRPLVVDWDYAVTCRRSFDGSGIDDTEEAQAKNAFALLLLTITVLIVLPAKIVGLAYQAYAKYSGSKKADNTGDFETGGRQTETKLSTKATPPSVLAHYLQVRNLRLRPL